MLDSLFTSVLSSESTASTLTNGAFLLRSLASLALGVAIACIYMFRHRYTKNFVVTLALLPLIVQMVIALVNGNIGAGIAVMAVFNLVRFRSIPGSAKDIGAVFLAMAVGLATGMGYLTLAILFTAIVAIANTVLVLSPLGMQSGGGMDAQEECAINISGGTLELVCTRDGDSIDSNGSIALSGGTVYVSGTTAGDNGAIDSGTGATVSGGTILALSAQGMTETFDRDSTQASIVATGTIVSAGDTVAILDGSGTQIARYTAANQASWIIASDPSMVEGQSYSVQVNGTNVATATATTQQAGNGSGGRGR